MTSLARTSLGKIVTNPLTKLGLLTEGLDYHLIRGSMVIIFLFFGYQKWFEYEAQVLIPYISNGPLIFWMYPVFGVRGASWFLGIWEWSFGVLLFLGFWNKRIGILGALGSSVTFLESVPRLHAGLQSFLSISRMEARRRKASALWLRFSQSLARRRQRPSQAIVRSTIHRLGRTTKPLARSERRTISVMRPGMMLARQSWNTGPA
jgi:hypothetical protein